MPFPTAYFLLRRLKEYGVAIETETSVIRLSEDGALASKNGRRWRLEGFDTIVLALGTKSVNSLKGQLEHRVSELYVVGDAFAPRQAIDAIEEGAKVALKI